MAMMIFIFFAVLSVITAVLIITQKNPMHSVLYLAFSVLSVSGLFFTLQADFLGAIQIIVYAGGIVVLYVFVIIIINLNQLVPEKRKLFPRFFITAVPLVLIIEIFYVFYKKIKTGSDISIVAESMKIENLSKMLLTDYVIPFEVASVLLLAVLIGSLVIARKELKNDTK